jgi:hypothetical protein
MPSGASTGPSLHLPPCPFAGGDEQSVWRHRRPGSEHVDDPAHGAHCSGRCTSVRIGNPVAARTRQCSEPSSMPGPRCAPALEQIRLSKLAHTILPGTDPRVARGRRTRKIERVVFEHAGSGNQEQRITAEMWGHVSRRPRRTRPSRASPGGASLAAAATNPRTTTDAAASAATAARGETDNSR